MGYLMVRTESLKALKPPSLVVFSSDIVRGKKSVHKSATIAKLKSYTMGLFVFAFAFLELDCWEVKFFEKLMSKESAVWKIEVFTILIILNGFSVWPVKWPIYPWG
jgi:hypothetical protein